MCTPVDVCVYVQCVLLHWDPPGISWREAWSLQGTLHVFILIKLSLVVTFKLKQSCGHRQEKKENFILTVEECQEKAAGLVFCVKWRAKNWGHVLGHLESRAKGKSRTSCLQTSKKSQGSSGKERVVSGPSLSADTLASCKAWEPQNELCHHVRSPGCRSVSVLLFKHSERGGQSPV